APRPAVARGGREPPAGGGGAAGPQGPLRQGPGRRDHRVHRHRRPVRGPLRPRARAGARRRRPGRAGRAGAGPARRARRPARSVRRLAPLAIALVLVAGACTDPDEDASSDPPTTTEPQTRPTTARDLAAARTSPLLLRPPALEAAGSEKT